MLLGKRPRPRPGPPMKRTTSLSEITTTLDLNSTVAAVPDPTSFNFNEEEAFNNFNQRVHHQHHHERVMDTNHRRHSADFSHTNNTFLRSCSLCKRPLVPTRDIYMYRGDSAFCSVECREQAMNEDERKDKVKCSLLQASKTKNKVQPPSSNLTNNNAQTLAAAAL